MYQGNQTAAYRNGWRQWNI